MSTVTAFLWFLTLKATSLSCEVHSLRVDPEETVPPGLEIKPLLPKFQSLASLDFIPGCELSHLGARPGWEQDARLISECLESPQDGVLAAFKPKMKAKEAASRPNAPPVLPPSEDSSDPLDILPLPPPPYPAPEPQPDCTTPSLPCLI